MARAGKGMGHDTVQGHQDERAVRDGTPLVERRDIADRKHGDNKLQGDDQENVRNQRESWPHSQ